jgi:membrane-associated phospholipid phosphatase
MQGCADRPISLRTRAQIALAATAVNALVYLLANHLALRPLSPLPWTALDGWVPFVPATLWIYISDYVLVATAFLLLPGRLAVMRYLRALVAMLMAGAALHLLWPTAYPREAFPVVGGGLTAEGLRLLRWLDTPSSCMPSMHVATSCLAALALRKNPRWQFASALAWTAVIAVSTLTAKQHYAVDLLGGVLLAGAFWLLFLWEGAAAEEPGAEQASAGAGGLP